MLGGIGKAIRVWREAAQAQAREPKRRWGAHEAEFQPAVIELMAGEPSRTGRILTWAIVGFLVIGIAWSWIGKVDIVVVAQGRIVPAGHTKTVQAPELGIVTAIHVKDGDVVVAGQVLLELDPTVSAADRERLAREVLAARLDRARLEALLADPLKPDAHFRAPEEAPESLIATHIGWMRAESARLRAQLRGLSEEETRRGLQREASAEQLRKIERSLPLVRENAEAIGRLARQGHASKLRANEQQLQLVTAEQDREIESRRLAEAEAALAAVREQQRQVHQEYRAVLLKDMVAASERQAGLEQELRKATQRGTLQRIRAPIAGTVHQLQIATIGGVLQPAEVLLQIVPQDAPLEVEALLESKDVGFVQVGQPAEIKFDAWPFTIWGTRRAVVTLVSADMHLKPMQQAAVRPEKGSSTAVTYLVRMALVDSGHEILVTRAGLAAAAEIRIDRRRVLQYLLSPLQGRQQEAMRER